MSQAVLKQGPYETRGPETGVDTPVENRSPQRPTLASVAGSGARPATKPASNRGWALAVTVGLGVGSVLLYLMLFEYSAVLAALSEETRHGHKVYAVVPMVIALVFSAVHGAFTGHFWDLLGLKAKGQ